MKLYFVSVAFNNVVSQLYYSKRKNNLIEIYFGSFYYFWYSADPSALYSYLGFSIRLIKGIDPF